VSGSRPESCTARSVRDLVLPVSTSDHFEGSLDAPIILLEYGDYECPHCTAAHPAVKEIQAELAHRLCFAYRHFPLVEIHPYAEPAAEAAEAASGQGRFWAMHDTLFEHSPALDYPDLVRYAARIGLDLVWFRREMERRHYLPCVQEDMESGVASGVRGTPTFFINGVRHEGGYDLSSLLTALRVPQ
jgi:protein-disulfide isomerase